MDKKNRYLMETNLNVDKAREIKELTQKNPRQPHSVLINLWFNFSSQSDLWFLESHEDSSIAGMCGIIYQNKFVIVLNLQQML